MKKLMLSICICLSALYNVQSQDIPVVMPPSPEAAALGKFIEVPVSHYTGVPNISIPFYTINAGAVQVPVHIAYHARGIQVEEHASRVGLGWVLNAGGVITRKVRGKADDALDGYLRGDFYDTFFTSEATRMAVYDDVINDLADLDPDAFSFNFPGFSGKFVFDQKTKKPVIQKFEDLKIEPIFENGTAQSIIIAWIITDKYGIQYYFGNAQDGLRTARDEEEILNQYTFSLNNGMMNNGSGPATYYYNSWYLLDIITPQGQSIAFLYEKEYPEYHRRSYDAKVFDDVNDGINTEDVVANFSKIRSHQHQLKRITFNGGRVEFTSANTPREDLEDAYALDNISIYDKNDSLINTFTFQYHYITSPNDNNQLDYLKVTEPQAAKRLFLESITEQGTTNTSTKVYSFDYSDEVLPNRFSTSQDNWGYYNGKNNGPFLTFFGYNGLGIDRSVDLVKSEAGMLKKITYPTGGSTSFTFEHNQGIPPAGVSNLFYSLNNPTEAKWEGMLKSALHFTGVHYEKTIVIGANKVGPVRSVVQFGDSTGCSTFQNQLSCHYQVMLLGDTSYNLYMGDHGNLVIEPGEYLLRVIPNGPENPDDFENGFVVSLHWEEQGVSDETFFYAAGKRIKTIEFDDGQGNTTQKTYTYTHEDGTTSGKLFALPNFHWIQSELSPGVPVIDKYGSRPGSPLTALQGNSIGYSRVIEFSGDNTTNLGKVEYTFTTYEDSGTYFQFPYHLPTDNEWLRGAPLTIKYFKRQNAEDYVLQRQIAHVYQYEGTAPNPLNLIHPQLPPDQLHSYINTNTQFSLPLIIFTLDDGDFVNTDHNDYKIFHLSGGTTHLHQSTETIYEEGVSPFTTSTHYTYDYNINYQRSETETTTSLGETYKTITYYPEQVNQLNGLQPNEITTINALTNQHRIAEPIRTQTYKIDEAGSEHLLSTKHTRYAAFNGVLRPEIIQTSKNEEGLEKQVMYMDYDDFGNPLEIFKADSTTISYIWGYQNTLPIVKLEGISYSEIDPIVIANLQNLSDNDTDALSEQILHDALNALRSSHPDAVITTYTYDPLVGVSSSTDTREQISFYHYDDFNRLIQITDHNHNSIETFRYNYSQE